MTKEKRADKKIRDFFQSSEDFSEDRARSYFALVRQSLEANGDKSNFPTLIHFSNWALHDRLNRKDAVNILKDLVRDIEENAHDYTKIEFEKTFVRFFAELKKFHNSRTLEIDRTLDIERRELFVDSLFDAITDVEISGEGIELNVGGKFKVNSMLIERNVYRAESGKYVDTFLISIRLQEKPEWPEHTMSYMFLYRYCKKCKKRDCGCPFTHSLPAT